MSGFKLMSSFMSFMAGFCFWLMLMEVRSGGPWHEPLGTLTIFLFLAWGYASINEPEQGKGSR